MSETCYPVAICRPPISPDDKIAWQELDGIIETGGDPPEIFRLLYGRLTARYPPNAAVPDDEIENWVWGEGTLWNRFRHKAAVLDLVWSRMDEVLPFLIEASNALGLTVFDWGDHRIHRPGKGVPVDWLRRWMT
jgi:hypothetical protein